MRDFLVHKIIYTVILFLFVALHGCAGTKGNKFIIFPHKASVQHNANIAKTKESLKGVSVLGYECADDSCDTMGKPLWNGKPILFESETIELDMPYSETRRDYALFFYKEQMLVWEQKFWSTGKDASIGPFDIYLAKAEGCKAEMTYSDISFSLPSSIEILQAVSAPFRKGSSLRWYPSQLNKFYESKVSLTMIIKDAEGRIVHHKTESAFMGFGQGSRQFLFGWTPPYEGKYSVNLTSAVDDQRCLSNNEEKRAYDFIVEKDNVKIVTPLITQKGPDVISQETGRQLTPLRVSKLYAIVIGINDYHDLPVQAREAPLAKPADLLFAEDDARKFINFLRSPERSGGTYEIREFLGPNATSFKVREGIDEILTGAEPDSLIVFFFSGHGRHTPFSQSEIYLMTYDAKWNDYYSGIPYDWIRRKIDESHAQHIVAYIDACRSGTIGFSKGSSASLDNKLLGNLQTVSPTKVIFTSGDGGQSSFEDITLKSGIFAHYLIKGLNGEAKDTNRDGLVNLSELYEFVKEKVEAYTKENPRMQTQTPRLWERRGRVDGQLPLAVRK